MNFGTIILDQSMETRQNYAIQILTALLFTLKPKIFLKIFLMLLRNGLIRLTDKNDKRPLAIGKNKRPLAIGKKKKSTWSF